MFHESFTQKKISRLPESLLIENQVLNTKNSDITNLWNLFNSLKKNPLPPNFRSLRAVFTHFYFRTASYQGSPKLFVCFWLPEAFKGLFFQISQPIRCVLIKTAGNYQPIPGNDAAMPHFPAVIHKLVFDAILPISFFGVPGLFVNRRNQRIAVFVIVNLSGFQPHFVYAQLSR